MWCSRDFLCISVCAPVGDAGRRVRAGNWEGGADDWFGVVFQGRWGSIGWRAGAQCFERNVMASRLRFWLQLLRPVLINGAVFPDEGIVNDYAITPMRWGLIPSWYKGSLHDCPLKNNNCRYEGLLEKPTFRGAAKAGLRCVILADGFYEWKVVGPKKKQPYFIYFPQKEGPDSFIKDLESISQETEWDGPQLLTMAGLFDVWKSPSKEAMYSYSIITMDSSKTISFVHHRMPAILSGKDEVSMWLDTNRVPTKDALSLLKPIDDLQMHPVSTLVNFSKNNSIECLKLFKEPEKTVLKKTGLTSWLIKGPSKESPPAKRMKPDP